MVCGGLQAAGDCGAAEIDVQAKYFRGLRQRRLFELAETYCRDQLRRDDLADDERLELSIELTRTLADHAVHATDVRQRAELWKQAHGTVEDLIKADPNSPRLPLLKYQAALLDASQGQSLRYQSELTPYDSVIRERSARLLKRAIKQFRVVRQDVERGLAAESTVSKAELTGLAIQVQHREAVATVDLAIVLPHNSPDRAATLLDAVNLLNELPRTSPQRASFANVQLLLARCLRLQGHHEQSLKLLKALSKSGDKSALGERIAAERIRTLLTMKQPDEAEKLIDGFVLAKRKLSAELAFLNVRILAAQFERAQKTGTPAEADKLLKLLRERSEKVATEMGGYWGNRARVALELQQESMSLGQQLSLSIREARSLYSHGEIVPAIEKYGSAAAEAFRSGKPELAFDLAFTRASLQLRAKQFVAAEHGFRELRERFPDNPRVAEAALLRAYALGQVYNGRRTKSHREAYTAALEEHRKQFDGHPTAVTATWMLAGLEEQRLQTTVALKLYQSVPLTHTRGQAAQIAVARCYEKILTRLRKMNLAAEKDWQQRAQRDLRAILPSAGEKRPALTVTQSTVATYLARIDLSRRNPDFRAADDLLAWVFASHSSAEIESGDSRRNKELRKVLATATQLRVVSLAGQNRPEEAGALLGRLSETSPADMLRILDGLSQLVNVAGQDMRLKLGTLQLRAVETLEQRRDELNMLQQLHLDRCRAQAFRATGRIDEADDLYAELRKAQPKDRDLQASHAEVLLACGTRSCLKRARSLWGQLEKSNKSGSQPWLEARYHRALCAFELQEYEECRKMLGIAAQLYPELGGPELKGQFEELSKRANKKTQQP